MIELHAIATANGQKAAIMLEECGLDYEVKLLDMGGRRAPVRGILGDEPGRQDAGHRRRDGPGGKAVTVFETLAIAAYACDKSGKMMPGDAAARAAAWEWAAACATNLAPALSFQYQLTRAVPDTSGPSIEYILGQAARLFKALDTRLGDAEYLAAEYSFADVQVYPVAATSGMRMPEGLAPYPNIRRWCDAVAARPGVTRGMNVMPPLG